jgi:hypothetical protein
MIYTVPKRVLIVEQKKLVYQVNIVWLPISVVIRVYHIGYIVICPSNYGFRLSLWDLQTFYMIYLLDNTKEVNRRSNSNKNRHEKSLSCWLGRGTSIKSEIVCFDHSSKMLTLTCNWMNRIVVMLNFIHTIFVLHDI